MIIARAQKIQFDFLKYYMNMPCFEKLPSPPPPLYKLANFPLKNYTYQFYEGYI